MPEVYELACEKLGVVDCTFTTRGENLEEILRQTADHAAKVHGMKGFGPELYTKMRAAVHTVEQPNG